MSILVTFFGGQPERVRRCLETGGWPPKELPAGSTEEVGFKFYVLPEEALNALVTSATALARTEPFRFESSVAGLLAPDGESFVGTVGGRFVDLFACGVRGAGLVRLSCSHFITCFAFTREFFQFNCRLMKYFIDYSLCGPY